MTLWGGRFSEPSDDDLRALNDSLPYDKRLYREDIRGSIVYALALVKAGVITKAEAQQIEQGLEQVLAEFETGTFALKPEDEDIHTAVERRLTEIIGETGGKLHTGRSRNDQIATDMRLWVRREMVGINNRLLPLQEALVEQAAAHVEDVMPGYTHMQPAQPVTAGHWLMSYFWMLQRDRTRVDVSIIHAEELPLGSGALAGTPLDIDRMVLGFNSELQFEGYTQNSLDAVSDRDFVADSLYALSMIGIHLSRLAEDLIIFSNPLFGFVTLDDRYSTGSSLMPQKRNPDPMELMRGKTGRLIGNLTGFLTTLKGLPTGYNKDLQEDKEALFDSVDTMNKLLPVITAIIRTLRLNPDRMRAALDENMLATDLADYLVKKGMPFRQAHHVSGRAVRLAGERGVKLSQLPLADLRELSDLFDSDTSAVFDFDASVARRRAIGGTAPDAVREQIEEARRLLE